MSATHYPDPDDLRAPGTDDEPWTVLEPDQTADRSWAQALALAVLIVVLVVVAIVWRR